MIVYVVIFEDGDYLDFRRKILGIYTTLENAFLRLLYGYKYNEVQYKKATNEWTIMDIYYDCSRIYIQEYELDSTITDNNTAINADNNTAINADNNTDTTTRYHLLENKLIKFKEYNRIYDQETYLEIPYDEYLKYDKFKLGGCIRTICKDFVCEPEFYKSWLMVLNRNNRSFYKLNALSWKGIGPKLSNMLPRSS